MGLTSRNGESGIAQMQSAAKVSHEFIGGGVRRGEHLLPFDYRLKNCFC